MARGLIAGMALGVLCAVLTIGGLVLWWPPSEVPDRDSELGAALLGGAAIALVALAFEGLLSARGRARAEREAQERERRSVAEAHERERLRRSEVLRQRIATAVRTPEGRLPLAFINAEGLDLAGERLAEADLQDAKLAGADLSYTDLGRTRLTRADLRGANLSWADLSRADLAEAALASADLCGAYMVNANVDWEGISACGSLAGANCLGLTVQDRYCRRPLTPEETAALAERGAAFAEQAPCFGPPRPMPTEGAV